MQHRERKNRVSNEVAGNALSLCGVFPGVPAGHRPLVSQSVSQVKSSQSRVGPQSCRGAEEEGKEGEAN